MSGNGVIWLVGMMGAGKSTVGAGLARRLGRRFVDTDAVIERKAGLSISQIFERDGESGFRVLEREVVADASCEPVVVALGGGAFAEPEAVELLLTRGVAVYLRAQPESLLERIGRPDSRPLLRGLARDERLLRLRLLLAEREPCYRRAAVVVDTDSKSAAQVVDEAAARIARLPGCTQASR